MNKLARDFMMKNLRLVRFLGLEHAKFPGLVSVSHIDPALTFRSEDSEDSKRSP